MRYALLGYLYDTPLSGYDLARIFDTSVGFFWSASHSQIYPELSRMESEGLLTSERIEQPKRPAKTLYRATPNGREEFKRWMREPSDLPVIRLPFLVKTFFMDKVGRKEAVRMIEEHENMQRERLGVYEGLQGVFEKALERSPRSIELESRLLTVKYGRMYVEGVIEWCELAKGVFEAHGGAGKKARAGAKAGKKNTAVPPGKGE